MRATNIFKIRPYFLGCIATSMTLQDTLELVTYFLFLFRLSDPPVESKSEASRVAGFLEARNAEIRRYFAEVDIWKSISSKASEPCIFEILFLMVLSLLAGALSIDSEVTVNVSFKDRITYGWIELNNFLFMSSLGTVPEPPRGSQYFLNRGVMAVDISSTRLVILQKGRSTRLFNNKTN